MNVAWWVSINGDQKGPLSTATLRQWFSEGRIPPEALVRPDNGAWQLAKKVKLRKTDWNAIFNGIVLAAGMLLAIEAFWLLMINPTAGRWTLGLLVFYISVALRVVGLGRIFIRKKA